MQTTHNFEASKSQEVLPNNFVINVATVNGSGSQSANNILLKSLFRMGVPVGGKNVFPSNIAGLPTWFWIRANSQGFVGRKSLAQILVALNPKTLKADLDSLAEGGYFFYPSNGEKLESSQARAGARLIPVPFKELTDKATDSPKIKKLVTNMVYVGILSQLLKMDSEIVEGVIGDILGKKASVLEVNLKAYRLGAEWAKTELAGIGFPFAAKKGPPPQGKMILDGNSAAALGLIHGGCTFGSWYPITPSSSLMESFMKFAHKVRKDSQGKNKYAVLQAEDELAAIAMVLGAGWAGARAVTATSGPGLSLMAEAAGYAYFAEIPCVIWDVQRMGPSTGLPTRTLQGDLLFASQLSHGDKKHPILIPGTVQECFEFGQKSLDLAERLQQLVIVLSDLDLGMNLWMTDQFDLDKSPPLDRGKVLSEEQISKLKSEGKTFYRYEDLDGDGIPYRTLPGNSAGQAAYFTRGSGHNFKGQYTESHKEHRDNMERLQKKWETAKSLMPPPLVKLARSSSSPGGGASAKSLQTQSVPQCLVYYGSTEIVMDEVTAELQRANKNYDQIRIRSYPFSKDVEALLSQYETIIVIEQNRDAQMKSLLSMDFPDLGPRMKSLLHYDGTPITSDLILEALL